ncbi:uncharacterized protein JN550_007394 [Neoarthrinium moseri]|uniref:uncharacterized protein n=1 Tax=Neoarthrinium moseri TaxID=1658444 RepID=UPI001FDC921B|nr:uncharacterized protein JN550_007394 [Neoarthrinium moseri]KAI1866847.1 hypothetical protein JN550_007394 [Neoarthrinium moseri]
MVKRKREEPRLEVNLQKWEKELVRGLKTAKGFERQRYSKRQREADPEKAARLEKEIAVLKSIDLPQAAHAHLCSSLLRIKGIAESPNLPAFIKPIPKPDLSEEEKTALHNVTSALCNRKHVKDVIDEAIMGTCIALRVPMPEKKGKAKGKNGRQDQEQQADDVQKAPRKAETETKSKSKTAAEKQSSKKSKEAPQSDEEDSGSGEPWEGFGSDGNGIEDSDAEEKAFSRFDGMLGGSSDEDSDGAASDDDAEDSRARSIRGPSDYFSGSSAEEDSDDEQSDAESDGSEDEEEDSEDDEAVSPPPKKAKKAAKPVPASSGNSTFLPSLMGGYISGSDSEASDIDIAPPMKKNRRGQRARQAIWEKKFKEKANHIKNQSNKSGRDQGWDMKRGAVGAEDAGPWKKGIRNPFEKKTAPEGVHPDRHANFDGSSGPPARKAGPPESQSRVAPPPAPTFTPAPAPAPKPKPKPSRDDQGSLHASWQAAKMAKEAAQKVSFQGKKVVFD